MQYIECKAQWLARPMRTQNTMSGFEGPAAKTDFDDGFGNPTIKGRITDSYNCPFVETGRDDQNNPVFDGTIRIPSTPANRYKIAQHVRAKQLRVKDRNMERVLLGENPPVARAERPKRVNMFPDMPDDFDGSKVRMNRPMVDEDPIEDPHGAVEDAEFTEVTAPQLPEPVAANVIKTSAAEAVAGAVKGAAKEAPKGSDPRANKNPSTEADKAQE